jgi:Trk K+ transport system NAD-binding subunit
VSVERGSDLDGDTVAALEASGESRVLLLDGPGGQRWRPPPDTVLEAGHDVAVVVTRQGLPQLLAASEGDAVREVAKPQAGP